MGELLDCWVALFFAGCASEEDEVGDEGCEPPSLKLRGAGPPSLKLRGAGKVGEEAAGG